MLTPNFELSQTDNDVVIHIRAPLANIAKTELIVDGNSVLFSSSPYYLRLHMPGELAEIDEEDGESNKYNSDRGEFTFTIQKATAGEHFPDLDLISTLLIPSKKFNVNPEIETINANEDSSEEADSEAEEDWFLEQKPVQLSQAPNYGFANKKKLLSVVDLRLEFSEVVDIVKHQMESDMDDTRSTRVLEEGKHFSEEHYLADLLDPPEELLQILQYKPSWEVFIDNNCEVTLSVEEKEQLKNLGNRNYLLDSSEKKMALLSLVDILFAYTYNQRTTLGENTVESGWTVNKLSSTLSWFECFSSMFDVKVACMTRSLTYPLYRHWELNMILLKDTYNILKLGRRQILRCLLQIHKLFNSSEPRYILNELYITDYCIWIQKISEKTIENLAASFEKVTITKMEVDDHSEIPLMFCETLASEELDLSQRMAKSLHITERSSEDESRSSESSGTLDSDDTSSEEEEEEDDLSM